MNEIDAVIALIQRINAGTGYSRAAGIEILHAAAGEVDLRMPMRADAQQFNGHFHGGAIAGLADHAGGAASTTAMPPGRVAVTVGMTLNFLAPAGGTHLVARARVVQAGKTIVVYNIDLYALDGGVETKCAQATVTSRAIPMPPHLLEPAR